MMAGGTRLPLHDITVLDLTHVWSGPMATRVLAGLGADVIKVESPRKPDALRGTPTDIVLRYPDLEPGEDSIDRNAWFNTTNVDKRAIAVDLKTERGMTILRDLVRQCDLVIANYRPGVLDRMGLGFDDLVRLNPQIVLVEMPGYTADSPQAGSPAFGAQFDAQCGSATLTGDTQTPLLTGFALGDPAAGLMAGNAALAALLRRRHTGEPSHVVLAQSEAMMPLLGEYFAAASADAPLDEGLNGDRRCLHQSIEPTGDGGWLAVSLQDHDDVGRFERVTGQTVGDGAGVARAAAAMTSAADGARRLQDAGIAAAPVAGAADLLADEQLAHAGFFRSLEHPSAGNHRYPSLPIRIDGERLGTRRPAPRFMADTAPVLAERLSLSPTQLAPLVRDGVIGVRPTEQPTTGAAMSDRVSYESRDGVAVVTIRRAEKLNALDTALVDGLQKAWERFEASDDRAAVLTAEGDRAFCAGADLHDPPAEMWQAVPGVGAEVSKPVVAAVFGHCVGGGYVIVQHCDLAVASTDTLFRYPEAQIGFTGGLCAGAVSRIPAKVAMEFLLLGEPMDAERAHAVGMVNKVVEPEHVLDEALAMAAKLAAGAPMVISTIKQFADEYLGRSPAEQQAVVRRELVRVTTSRDFSEGKTAFAEKRTPQFTGQ